MIDKEELLSNARKMFSDIKSSDKGKFGYYMLTLKGLADRINYIESENEKLKYHIGEIIRETEGIGVLEWENIKSIYKAKNYILGICCLCKDVIRK